MNPSSGLNAPTAIISRSETSLDVSGIFLSSLALSSAISLSFPLRMRLISFPPCGIDCSIIPPPCLKNRKSYRDTSCFASTLWEVSLLCLHLFYHYPVMFFLYLFFFQNLVPFVQYAPRDVLVWFSFINNNLKSLACFHIFQL